MTRKIIPIEGDLGSKIGYARAVRVGNHAYVSGTTSLENGDVLAKGDAGAQARISIEKISKALVECGLELSDVSRTRVCFTRIEDLEAIAEAHRHFFSEIQPASAFYTDVRFVHPDVLVEIEADAVIETKS